MFTSEYFVTQQKHENRVRDVSLTNHVARARVSCPHFVCVCVLSCTSVLNKTTCFVQSWRADSHKSGVVYYNRTAWKKTEAPAPHVQFILAVYYACATWPPHISSTRVRVRCSRSLQSINTEPFPIKSRLAEILTYARRVLDLFNDAAHEVAGKSEALAPFSASRISARKLFKDQTPPLHRSYVLAPGERRFHGRGRGRKLLRPDGNRTSFGLVEVSNAVLFCVCDKSYERARKGSNVPVVFFRSRREWGRGEVCGCCVLATKKRRKTFG